MTEPLYPAPLFLDPAWTADTVAVQAGRPARVAGAPMNAPVTLSSTYVQDATLEYGRDGNTSWGALEAALGALDGGHAVTFASGLAAATALAALVPPGGTVVLPAVAYFGVRNIFERMRADGRLNVRMVAADDTAAVIAAAVGADMVWMESIANPLIVVADVPAISFVAEWRTMSAPRSSGRSTSERTSSSTPRRS
jgi:cystathionine gamma-synthase